ncbi:SpoIIE family protein phosphatase [Pontiella sulfatireligans]|uniref:Phosphoserine phosphatase RsbP n=1 Tax=Pontiella sulfatireligans TaxID=2750658 RepID=A0A6C2UJ67_9BACT|nr:SpoIIE family protein phosphatase [Pontiella sulfatireligans]VGO19246.1 Phosphoserine phosphatase RsbP [Pontiella sulfatireligans]
MNKELYSAEFLLKRLMEKMTDSIYFKDLQSRFVMVNKNLANAWGYSSPDELIGKSDFDSFREDDARHMFEDEQAIIKSGEPLEGIEEETTWKNGHVAWSSTSKMPLIDDAGKVVGTFGISRNITEHKLAELQVARYAEEIRRIKEGMEEDLRMAAELQKSFFPTTYPIFPEGVSREESAVQFLHHYNASGMVSGDICAIRRLSGTECCVLLCDVMGHGVRAALGTALICAMVQELAEQERDPGRFLGRMNERLLPILRQQDVFLYATACYAVYDAASGRMRVANAGHPVPLLLKGGEKTAGWLMDDGSMRGPALAVCEDVVYQTFEKQLRAGDSVVMYTDGLYEALGTDDEEFGEERLLQAAKRNGGLPLQELFPAFVKEVCDYSADGEFDDDICLVGFTCRSLRAQS